MTTNLQKINAKNTLGYLILPGILPRLRELFGSGFGYLAFLIASVFQIVRILPAGHPMLSADNIGKFTIRQVLSTSANQIELKRQNADKIIVFGAVLLALVLLALQALLFLLALMTGSAFAGNSAGNAPFTNIFKTDNPDTDIAFMMLDYVFGLPGVFDSNAIADGPTPFHQGLHDLFQFYNTAILLVGVLIFLYYVVVVVVETAQTGVPFGRRFSKIYAPLRLVAAIGLLVPLPTGFNAAQYLTLYVSKVGSSFATNGWILYNSELENPMGVDNASLIAGATPPSVMGLYYFATIYHACRESYNLHFAETFATGTTETVKILPYIIVGSKAENFLEYSYEQALEKIGVGHEATIILGELNEEKHASFAGNVRPYCGQVSVSLSYQNPPYFKSAEETAADKEVQKNDDKKKQKDKSALSDKDIEKLKDQAASEGQISGVHTMQKEYFLLMQSLLNPTAKVSDKAKDKEEEQKKEEEKEKAKKKGIEVPEEEDIPDAISTTAIAALGERAAHAKSTDASDNKYNPCWESIILGDNLSCAQNPLPGINSLKNEIKTHDSNIQTAATNAIDELRKGMNLKLPENIKRYGWGGAGIWYNRVAEINGSLASAIYAAPSVKKYPEVMEHVKKEKAKTDNAVAFCENYKPTRADGSAISFEGGGKDYSVIKATNAMFEHWACEKNDASNGQSMTGNVMLDIIGVIFGINGLFQLQEQTAMDPETGAPEVHPVAGLSTIGKSLVENAIRSVALSMGAAFGGGMDALLSAGPAATMRALSSMFTNVATIGLTAGFILYYILPFLPFMYFFFAVGAWVKSIFEAMVGAPLWALAHLRIDGEGFSGKAASGGYFLLMEIMLRPIVTVFGLVGGMAVFGAMVGVLNSIFDMVVAGIVGAEVLRENSINVDGFDVVQLGAIDAFFFTIVYTIIVYMMATACFKMIDTIPKQFMRWLGTSVNTFNDNTGDPTANLTQYTAVAGASISGQIFGGMNQGAAAVGQAVNTAAKMSQPKGE